MLKTVLPPPPPQKKENFLNATKAEFLNSDASFVLSNFWSMILWLGQRVDEILLKIHMNLIFWSRNLMQNNQPPWLKWLFIYCFLTSLDCIARLILLALSARTFFIASIIFRSTTRLATMNPTELTKLYRILADR